MGAELSVKVHWCQKPITIPKKEDMMSELAYPLFQGKLSDMRNSRIYAIFQTALQELSSLFYYVRGYKLAL